MAPPIKTGGHLLQEGQVRHKNKGDLIGKAKKRMAAGETLVAKTTIMGFYTFVLSVPDIREDFHVKVTVETRRNGAYLSAMDWPLLPFFGTMSLVYLFFGLIWLVLCCLNWKDLLRIQFWIGGVIALGMLENALFYTEYSTINSSGEQNGLLYFAEVVSCIKRGLARILVIIISMGFGIVKPRLGEMLPRVLALGGIYIVTSAIEGILRITHGNISSSPESKSVAYAAIPLTVIDVAMCYWVFTALVQTTRTLRIRKNIVKLNLYRRFTNTLIFMVVASVAYMIWVIKDVNTPESCTTIWSVWLNEALWPFLFAVILLVIMVLWRPSKNSRRYDSFVPLENEDDEDDKHLSDNFTDTMKMRNVGDSTGVVKGNHSTEDDLRWVEENIPSVPSSLLPVLDSDEEVMTTKFEVSKMD